MFPNLLLAMLFITILKKRDYLLMNVEQRLMK